MLQLRRKLRVLLRHREIDRQFWWFEMNNNDFYWGPSTPGRLLGSFSPESQQLEITVPEDRETFEIVRSKASFHESGQFHIKATSTKTSVVDVDVLRGGTDKAAIRAPTRFMTLISKAIKNYKPYERSLTRGKTSAVVIDMSKSEDVSRLYVEFFLSPAGTFTFPPPLLKFKNHILTSPMTHSMSADLILVMNVYTLSDASELSSWQPEVEIAIYGLDSPSENL